MPFYSRELLRTLRNADVVRMDHEYFEAAPVYYMQNIDLPSSLALNLILDPSLRPILELKINGTPFNGVAYLDKDHYIYFENLHKLNASS